MVVKTTAIYIPLRTVLEKQYTVIRVEETKRLRVKETKRLKVEETKRLRVKELWRWQLVIVIVNVIVIAYTPPQ